MISGENNLFQFRENFLVKCNKTSSKIYKHIVQQKVQQKYHNIHQDVFFIKHTRFELNSATSQLKFNIYFWLLYLNLKFIVQHIVHFVVHL